MRAHAADDSDCGSCSHSYTFGAVAEEAGQVRNEELDAARDARRRAALAQIRQYGDPVLRLRAAEVDAFDDDLTGLVERMKRLMTEANGVGLAANQVGVLRRVFVMQAEPDAEPIAVVNPVLRARDGVRELDDEGCLSLRGVLLPVARDMAVTLEGHDAGGEPLRLELEGLPARVAAHELDHLDGVLILDRTPPEHRREALAVLRPRPVLDVTR